MKTERERSHSHRGPRAAPADRRGFTRPIGSSCDEPDSVRGVAAVARRLLSDVADGRLADPHMTVRFWDGSELPSDGPAAIVIRDPAAIVHLVRAPGQLGLARAWVDGSLDVDGDLEAVLKQRGMFAGIRLSAADRVATRARRFASVWRWLVPASPDPGDRGAHDGPAEVACP